MSDTTFFGTLGRLAGEERENQFSRTFLACFERSASFRRCILELLKSTCQISGRLPDADHWKCAVEVPTPRPGGGRPDIKIAATPLQSRIVFFLESKLKSALTLEQLKRYRKHGVEYLVAVTKHEPEVSRLKLQDAGIFQLRWQDVHRALLEDRPSNQTDRFIGRSMVAYLEELGMAYREDLTLSDIKQCRRVLNTIASSKDRHISPRNGFEVADACLRLLDDVRRRFVELNSSLRDHRRWGPGYFVWFDEHERRWDGFGWEIYKKGRYSKDHFGCRLWLSADVRATPRWDCYRTGSTVTDREKEWLLKTTVANGVLDQGKFVALLTKCAKRWGVV
jgi:hypothetical protein